MVMCVLIYECQQVVQVCNFVLVVVVQLQFGCVVQGVVDVGKMFDQWQVDVDEVDVKVVDMVFVKIV